MKDQNLYSNTKPYEHHDETGSPTKKVIDIVRSIMWDCNEKDHGVVQALLRDKGINLTKCRIMIVLYKVIFTEFRSVSNDDMTITNSLKDDITSYRISVWTRPTMIGNNAIRSDIESTKLSSSPTWRNVKSFRTKMDKYNLNYDVSITCDKNFGLGFRLDIDPEGRIIVNSFKKHPLSNLPLSAEDCGLIKIGDELLSINDQNIQGLSLPDAIKMIRKELAHSTQITVDLKFRSTDDFATDAAILQSESIGDEAHSDQLPENHDMKVISPEWSVVHDSSLPIEFLSADLAVVPHPPKDDAAVNSMIPLDWSALPYPSESHLTAKQVSKMDTSLENEAYEFIHDRPTGQWSVLQNKQSGLLVAGISQHFDNAVVTLLMIDPTALIASLCHTIHRLVSPTLAQSFVDPKSGRSEPGEFNLFRQPIQQSVKHIDGRVCLQLWSLPDEPLDYKMVSRPSYSSMPHHWDPNFTNKLVQLFKKELFVPSRTNVSSFIGITRWCHDEGSDKTSPETGGKIGRGGGRGRVEVVVGSIASHSLSVCFEDRLISKELQGGMCLSMEHDSHLLHHEGCSPLDIWAMLPCLFPSRLHSIHLVNSYSSQFIAAPFTSSSSAVEVQKQCTPLITMSGSSEEGFVGSTQQTVTMLPINERVIRKMFDGALPGDRADSLPSRGTQYHMEAMKTHAIRLIHGSKTGEDRGLAWNRSNGQEHRKTAELSVMSLLMKLFNSLYPSTFSASLAVRTSPSIECSPSVHRETICSVFSTIVTWTHQYCLSHQCCLSCSKTVQQSPAAAISKTAQQSSVRCKNCWKVRSFAFAVGTITDRVAYVDAAMNRLSQDCFTIIIEAYLTHSDPLTPLPDLMQRRDVSGDSGLKEFWDIPLYDRSGPNPRSSHPSHCVTLCDERLHLQSVILLFGLSDLFLKLRQSFDATDQTTGQSIQGATDLIGLDLAPTCRSMIHHALSGLDSFGWTVSFQLLLNQSMQTLAGRVAEEIRRFRRDSGMVDSLSTDSHASRKGVKGLDQTEDVDSEAVDWAPSDGMEVFSTKKNAFITGSCLCNLLFSRSQTHFFDHLVHVFLNPIRSDGLQDDSHPLWERISNAFHSLFLSMTLPNPSNPSKRDDLTGYLTVNHVAFWLHDTAKVKVALYQHSMKSFKQHRKVAKIFLEMVLSNKIDKLILLAKGDSDRSGKQLFKLLTLSDDNFSSETSRNILRKNAFALIRLHRYREAAATFLLARPPMVKECCSVLAGQYHNPFMAFLVARLVEDPLRVGKARLGANSAQLLNETIIPGLYSMYFQPPLMNQEAVPPTATETSPTTPRMSVRTDGGVDALMMLIVALLWTENNDLMNMVVLDIGLNHDLSTHPWSTSTRDPADRDGMIHIPDFFTQAVSSPIQPSFLCSEGCLDPLYDLIHRSAILSFSLETALNHCDHQSVQTLLRSLLSRLHCQGLHSEHLHLSEMYLSHARSLPPDEKDVPSGILHPSECLLSFRTNHQHNPFINRLHPSTTLPSQSLPLTDNLFDSTIETPSHPKQSALFNFSKLVAPKASSSSSMEAVQHETVAVPPTEPSLGMASMHPIVPVPSSSSIFEENSVDTNPSKTNLSPPNALDIFEQPVQRRPPRANPSTINLSSTNEESSPLRPDVSASSTTQLEPPSALDLFDPTAFRPVRKSSHPNRMTNSATDR